MTGTSTWTVASGLLEGRTSTNRCAAGRWFKGLTSASPGRDQKPPCFLNRRASGPSLCRWTKLAGVQKLSGLRSALRGRAVWAASPSRPMASVAGWPAVRLWRPYPTAVLAVPTPPRAGKTTGLPLDVHMASNRPNVTPHGPGQKCRVHSKRGPVSGTVASAPTASEKTRSPGREVFSPEVWVAHEEKRLRVTLF